MKEQIAFLRSCLFVVMLLAFAVPGLEVKAAPPPANTWAGAVSTDWSTASNWSLGTVPCSVPGVCEDVVIPSGTAHQPIVSASPGACNNLTINSGAQLTIQNGFDMMDTLTVDGVLIIQDLGGGAYLDLDSSVIVNTGGKIVLGPNAAGGNFGIGLRNASATVTVAGTLQVIGDNALRDFDSGSASLTIQPSGLLQIDDAGPFDVQALVINNGTMKQTQAVPAGATTHFLNLRDADSDVDQYLGVAITPDTTALGSTTVTIRGNRVCNTGDQLIHRCFDIAAGSPQSAKVRFWYLNSERNGQDVSQMKGFHWDGTAWQALTLATPPRGTQGSYEWFEAINVSSYSPFGLSTTTPSATPTAITLRTLAANRSAIPLGGILAVCLLALFGGALLAYERK